SERIPLLPDGGGRGSRFRSSEVLRLDNWTPAPAVGLDPFNVERRTRRVRGRDDLTWQDGPACGCPHQRVVLDRWFRLDGCRPAGHLFESRRDGLGPVVGGLSANACSAGFVARRRRGTSLSCLQISRSTRVFAFVTLVRPMREDGCNPGEIGRPRSYRN